MPFELLDGSIPDGAICETINSKVSREGGWMNDKLPTILEYRRCQGTDEALRLHGG